MSTTLDIIRIGSEPQKIISQNKISSSQASDVILYNILFSFIYVWVITILCKRLAFAQIRR
jgi:hypothetical protein